MKPKDLPFTIKSFSSREPSFIDNVLTIPPFYTNHQKENLSCLYEKFDSFKTKHIEICSGNGEWITERAKNNPLILYIAVEKKFVRVRKIWSKMKNHELNNLIIVSGMGEDFFHFYLENNSINEIFINFPDPWPKKRHAKHRIIKPSFILPIEEKLILGGKITITTDSDDYAFEILSVFKEAKGFENIHPDPGYSKLDETYGGSYFKRLWSDLGRNNKLISFKRVEN